MEGRDGFKLCKWTVLIDFNIWQTQWKAEMVCDVAASGEMDLKPKYLIIRDLTTIDEQSVQIFEEQLEQGMYVDDTNLSPNRGIVGAC